MQFGPRAKLQLVYLRELVELTTLQLEAVAGEDARADVVFQKLAYFEEYFKLVYLVQMS